MRCSQRDGVNEHKLVAFALLLIVLLTEVVHNPLVKFELAGHNHRLSNGQNCFLGTEYVHIVVHPVFYEQVIEVLGARGPSMHVPGNRHDPDRLRLFIFVN